MTQEAPQGLSPKERRSGLQAFKKEFIEMYSPTFLSQAVPEAGRLGLDVSLFRKAHVLTVTEQTWPKHQLPGCGNYWILLRGDVPNLAAFSLATLERFTSSPGQIFGSKQDPFISALA